MERLTETGIIYNFPKLDPAENQWLERVQKRLACYEELEEQGRLVFLPCKVGDKAYWVNGGQIKTCKVHRIQVNRKGTFLVLRSTVVHGAFNIGTIGHTVFFDREEAEQTLGGVSVSK